MDVKYFVTACSFLIVVFVIEMIRREKMTFKYAMTWLSISCLALVLSVSDTLLYWVSHLAGFKVPSNFVFFVVSIFVFFLSLLLTIYANDQNKRTEILAQSLAILEYQLQEVNTNIERLSKRNSHPRKHGED